MDKRIGAGVLAAGIVALAASALAQGAGGAKPGDMPKDMEGRPNQWGYKFGRSYDAEIAAPQVHRVPFENEHIMLMEVSNPPGYRMQMHGHPYPSIFARASGGTTAQGLAPSERFLEPDSKQNAQNWRNGAPPKGLTLPTCTAADPQSPHLPINNSQSPLHFYRIEFKRIDQDNPEAMKTLYAKAPPIKRLYENEVVRLLEVTIPPGGKDPGRANPTIAVLAFDTTAAFDALDRAESADAGRSAPPQGMTTPRCMTVAGKIAPVVENKTALPIHYYRIEFKRIDGDSLKDNWRTWYPHMTEMQRQQQQ